MLISVNLLDYILETAVTFIHILYIFDCRLFFCTAFDVDQCFLMIIGIYDWQRESEHVIVVIFLTSFPSRFIIVTLFIYFELLTSFLPFSLLKVKLSIFVPSYFFLLNLASSFL